MIRHIEAQARHCNDFGWLKTCWLFSFGNYHDPENINHGTLRVFNDDIVQPGTGFGTHPHEEMEIISIVLDGEMTHKDSMGNKTVIRRHDVQRMSAGTGLHHSEWNNGPDPVAFFQIWILPDQKGLAPSYDQKSFSPDAWENRLLLLASNKKNDGAVFLNTEGSLYRCRLESERSVRYEGETGRCRFIYVIDGTIAVNAVKAKARDQLRISGEGSLAITADENTDFVLLDIPA